MHQIKAAGGGCKMVQVGVLGLRRKLPRLCAGVFISGKALGMLGVKAFVFRAAGLQTLASEHNLAFIETLHGYVVADFYLTNRQENIKCLRSPAAISAPKRSPGSGLEGLPLKSKMPHH